MKVELLFVGKFVNAKILTGYRKGQFITGSNGQPVPYLSKERAREWLKGVGYEILTFDSEYRGFKVMRNEVTGRSFYIFLNDELVLEEYNFYKLSDAHEIIDHHYGYFGK